MGFQTNKFNLPKLLGRIEDGEWQLPDFQRSYRWDSERVRSLVLTVVRGYPLGALLTISANTTHVRFGSRVFEGVPTAKESVTPTDLVLDGQQRLTSLFQTMAGTGIARVTDPRGSSKELLRMYFVKCDLTWDAGNIPDEAIVDTDEKGIQYGPLGKPTLDLSTPELQAEQGYFPVHSLARGASHKWILGSPDQDVAQEFYERIVEPVRGYEIPAIALDASTTRGAVTTIFDKVNTGGMRLDVFELLTATYAGDPDYHREHGESFNLRDDWAETVAVIEAAPVLEGFDSTKFLQAVTLLASHETSGRTTTARRADILSLDLADYRSSAERIRTSLAWVEKFLHSQYIYTANDIPYDTQIVPLAVVHALLGDAIGPAGASRRMRQWFWCGVLGELYSSATETRFARDVDDLVKWVPDGAGAEPATVREAQFSRERLLTIRTRNSAAYKGVYSLILQKAMRDWILDQDFTNTMYDNNNVDIHHVFPKAWCEKKKISASVYNSILNKTPLAAKTNRSIGGRAPSAYLGTVATKAQLSASEVDDVIRTHAIDPAFLRVDDFDGFVRDRVDKICDLISAAMGKSVTGEFEVDPSAPTSILPA